MQDLVSGAGNIKHCLTKCENFYLMTLEQDKSCTHDRFFRLHLMIYFFKIWSNQISNEISKFKNNFKSDKVTNK